MNKFSPIVVALLLSTQIFYACRSSKPSNAASPVSGSSRQASNNCGQTIKYLCTKGKFLKSGKEEILNLEMIVDPAEKGITLNLESPEKGKGSIKSRIINIDCSLNAALTEGSSEYRALSEGPGGQDMEVVFRLVAGADGLTVSFSNEKEKGALVMKVDRWDLVTQP